jgi:drug/metabolite transporter (DMT)-like permease
MKVDASPDGSSSLDKLEGLQSFARSPTKIRHTTIAIKEEESMNQFSQLVSTPVGAFLVLAIAAYLEVQGDACFQSGLYRSSGAKQIGWFVAGAVVLVCYSLFLNFSQIDFGKLLGIYVVLFFLVAQIVATLQFHQSPSKPIYVGGAFVVVGGLIMTLWRG